MDQTMISVDPDLDKLIAHFGIQQLQQMDRTALRAKLPKDDVGDRLYAMILFLRVHRRRPGDETLFNDHIFRIKTTNAGRSPDRCFVSDKYLAKIYVKAIAGDGYNVPTLELITSADAVDRHQFPDECCIKPTHMSGQVILRTRGSAIDRSRIKRWLQTNFYDFTREPQYKYLVPRVIVEPLVFGVTNPHDFKFHCYKGQPKVIQIDIDRYTDHRRLIVDLDWVDQGMSMTYPKFEGTLPRPENLSQMTAVAAKLAANFDYVRIDLYSNGVDCMVGEITNTPGNASETFASLDMERRFSQLIFGR
jgi:hypothetical protein